MHEDTREFLRELADLMERYDAGLSYTTSDDGLHLDIAHEPAGGIRIGFLSRGYAAKEIRTILEEGK